jgi:hypothetical protein
MGVEQLLIQIDILLVRLGYNLFTQVGKFNIVIQQDINDCYGDPISDSKVEIFIGEKEFYCYDYLYGKLDYYDTSVSDYKFRELMVLKDLLDERVKQRSKQ